MEPTRFLMDSCFHCVFFGAISSADAPKSPVFDYLSLEFLDLSVVESYCRFSRNFSQSSAMGTAVSEEEETSYRKSLSMPAAEYVLLLFGEVVQVMPTVMSLIRLLY